MYVGGIDLYPLGGSISLMLQRQQRIRIWVGVVMVLYFTIYFLMLTHIFEQNKSNPYQGRAHDGNGIPIG